MNARLLSVLSCVIALVSTSAFAQSGPLQAGGFNLNRAYFSQLPEEHIDTASGNLLLTFTDLELPGDAGAVLRLQRTYNSNRAEWRFGPAGFAEAAFFGTDTQGFPQGPFVRTVDGAVHYATWRSPACSGPVADPCGFYLTKEFWLVDVAGHRVFYPDGTVDTFAAAPGGPLFWLDARVDAFGNAVVFSRNKVTHTVAVTQSVGTGSRTVSYQADANDVIRSMTYDGRTWAFDYDPVFNKLATVTPPIGPAWRFEYGAAPSGTYWGTPVLAAMTTPNGGRIQYSYAAYDTKEACPATPPVPGCTVSVAVVNHRQVSGPRVTTAEWTYTYPEAGLGNAAVIIGPDQDRTELTYTNEGSAMDADGNPSELNLLRRIVKAPGGNTLESDERHYINVPVTSVIRAGIPTGIQGSAVLSTRTIARQSATFTTTMGYSGSLFGDYHHPRTVTEAGSAGTLTTTYDYEYGFDIRLFGRPAKQTVSGPEGRAYVHEWTYDPSTGFVKSETALGIRHEFTKDARGNRRTDKNGNSHVTTMDYAWGAVSSVSTPDVTTVREIRPDGLVQAETTAGRRTAFEYDAIGRTTRITPPGAVNPIQIDYDNQSGATMSSHRGTPGVSYWSEAVDLDGLGRAVTSTNALGDATVTAYDAAGRISFQSIPSRGTPSSGSSMQYDALGRLTERREVSGASILASASIVYNGTTRTLTDENGRQSSQTWTAFGDPESAMLSQVIDAKNTVWSYAYSDLHQLARVSTDDGIARTWNYLPATDRLQSETHPESGTVAWTYDLAGNVKTKADPRQFALTYAYDDQERLVAVTGGDRPLTRTYEPGSNLPTGGTAPGVQTVIGYDQAGRVAARSEQVDGTMLTALFDYDANDNLRQITYPTGRHIRYSYDSAGHVTKVEDADTGAVFSSGFTYASWGATTGFTLGNGLVHQLEYDPVRLWTTRIQAGSKLDILYDLQDAVGNVRRIRESPAYAEQRFTYDALDRLETGTGPSWVLGYQYDRHGNRQSAGGTTYTYFPGTLRLQTQGSRSFGYDAAGNTTTDTGATFTYNADNLMSSATIAGTSTSYLYNCEGKRVRKSGGSTVLYAYGKDGELLSEWTFVAGAPVVAKDYIYAGARLIAVVTRTGS